MIRHKVDKLIAFLEQIQADENIFRFDLRGLNN